MHETIGCNNAFHVPWLTSDRRLRLRVPPTSMAPGPDKPCQAADEPPQHAAQRAVATAVAAGAAVSFAAPAEDGTQAAP